MVNVTHDNDDRRPRLEVLGIALTVIDKDIFFSLLLKELCVDAERIGNKACSIELEFLVDGSHNAELHKSHDDLGALLADTLSEFLNGNECRDLDLGYGLLLVGILLGLLLFLLLVGIIVVITVFVYTAVELSIPVLVTLVGKAALSAAFPALVIVVLLVESTLLGVVGPAPLDLVDRRLGLRSCRTSELVLLTGLFVLVLVESAATAVALISATAALGSSVAAEAALSAASCGALTVTACVGDDRGTPDGLASCRGVTQRYYRRRKPRPRCRSYDIAFLRSGSLCLGRL